MALSLGLSVPVCPLVAAQDEAPVVVRRDLQGEVGDSFEVLTAPGTDLSQRTEAALRLIAIESDQATLALAATLGPRYPSEVWRATLDALVTTRNDLPRREMPGVIAGMRTRLPAEIEQNWAAALGRYEMESIARELEAVAEDRRATLEQRRLAILALGEHRRAYSAEVLVGLTNLNELEAVQNWAFDALANLSHQPHLGRDRKQWAEWWGKARGLGATDWQRQLHENLMQLTAQQRAMDQQLRERLIRSQQQLYRNTRAEDKPSVLASMLRDPLAAIRDLGLEIARQRAEDGQVFTEPLMAELRHRLNDEQARIREQSATLLGQLLDADAADAMASRLAEGLESVASVQRQYLLALARMPREAAIEPVFEMLTDRAVQTEAAAAMAAMIRAELVPQAVRRRVRAQVREALGAVQVPQPELVTLMGQVLEPDDDDWDRIEGWLDIADDRVRDAAARAWAESGRPLLVLAERIEDPVVRPIALLAIRDHGQRQVTLLAIALRRPEVDENNRWLDAMVSMAPRVSPTALLEVIDELEKDEDATRNVRELMLTKAIDQAARPDPPTEAYLRLLLTRARTRPLTDAAELVVLDYEAVLPHLELLSETDTDRTLRGLTAAYLANDRLDEAFATAEKVLVRGDGSLTAGASEDPLVEVFLSSARRSLELDRTDLAVQILGSLRELLGGGITPEAGQRFSELQDNIEDVERILRAQNDNGNDETVE
ncbi:MAG: hypothetical protein AAGC72_12335 [Planctomycetota bacterium]